MTFRRVFVRKAWKRCVITAHMVAVGIEYAFENVRLEFAHQGGLTLLRHVLDRLKEHQSKIDTKFQDTTNLLDNAAPIYINGELCDMTLHCITQNYLVFGGPEFENLLDDLQKEKIVQTYRGTSPF